MKIVKFSDYITEKIHDTPESYISILLKKIKNKIDLYFENIEGGVKKSIDDKISFRDLGVNLDSSEISKYSKRYDNLTIKFSDSENMYTLIILIDIKEAIPKNKDKDFSIDDIKNCYIKFKKYDINTFEIMGQIDKNIKIEDINQNLLVDLKVEIDDKFSDEEEFKIET
jgi:hypothetical protein